MAEDQIITPNPNTKLPTPIYNAESPADLSNEVAKPITPVIPPQWQPVAAARTMDFPNAMRAVINGKQIRRESWGTKDYCLLKNGWLSIFTRSNFHTWHVNDGDMEGQDWVIVLSN